MIFILRFYIRSYFSLRTSGFIECLIPFVPFCDVSFLFGSKAEQGSGPPARSQPQVLDCDTTVNSILLWTDRWRMNGVAFAYKTKG